MVTPPAATAPPKFSPPLHASLLSLGKAVRAPNTTTAPTNAPFLTRKSYNSYVFNQNAYHQTALGGGVIPGKYPAVVEFCNKLKNERERARNHILLDEQVHRAELEDARTFREETRSTKEDSRHSKETSRAAKDAKKREKEKSKAKKARRRQAHSDDEGSIIFDDADLVDNNGEADDAMLVDDPVPELISTNETAPAATSTQSMDDRVLPVGRPDGTRATTVRISFLQLRKMDRTSPAFTKAMMVLSKTDPQPAGLVVAAEFPSLPRKRNRAGDHPAHEDSSQQFVGTPSSISIPAAELATNNHRVKSTVAEATEACESSEFPPTGASLRLEESDLRARISFTNAQLHYQLNHRQYLLKDLRRVLNSQHNRAAPNGIRA
ncbi:hypothetical protein B0H13DRAFT_1893379 [Mycena leptocephala]|nr:hypothetical protein B0H13DRAFT_1893379 [Mycena leptocephala]